MPDKNYLTVDEFRKMWKTEFLPSIRQEVKLEIETLGANIQVLTDRCSQIEQSMQFLSDKYDTVLGILQATKKQIAGLEANVKEQTDQISKLHEADYEKDCTIDAMQQYLRRDCIEITGIPTLPLDNPKQLVLELGSLIDVSISEDQISTAHRLPDTETTRIICQIENTHGSLLVYIQLQSYSAIRRATECNVTVVAHTLGTLREIKHSIAPFEHACAISKTPIVFVVTTT